jgi:Protein of unknown function (DUF3306)
MSESFLSRWSRRKRDASIPPPERRPPAAVFDAKDADAERRLCEASGGEGGDARDKRAAPGGEDTSRTELTKAPPTPDPSPPRASRAGGGEPCGPGSQTVPFDPATLPPIESINAGTDVSAFLRPGVPADLAQAALRRAWVADPAIRDFVGLAENAWDFNKPGGVPGFEPLRAIDDVQRLAAQVIGGLTTAAPEPAAAEQSEETQTSAQPAPAPPPQDTVPTPEPTDVAAQRQTSTAEHSPPRPRHGGALAE